MNTLTQFKAICACLREGFELLREAVAGVGAAGRCAVLGKQVWHAGPLVGSSRNAQVGSIVES